MAVLVVVRLSNSKAGRSQSKSNRAELHCAWVSDTIGENSIVRRIVNALVFYKTALARIQGDPA